uniref:Elongator complex protein 2 n=1 Tax=Kwoniella dejecticola CBS 10117 TaxID=1296121 RepID=A0A1A6A6V0_9TREE|nr:elongator complex protein 2 [Kwoniella dejecticola CBS 10117]OBR85784.1 elongator complex protein 2 [Kwoniella dejecticola CBS 10117]
MRVDPKYISVGSNRSSCCSACTSKGLVAFGAGKFIALWNTENPQRGVYRTLPGHKGQVTTVKLIDDSRIISSDREGEIRIWIKSTQDEDENEDGDGEWRCHTNWIAHPNASISAIGVSPDGQTIFTGGSDSTIRIWSLSAQGKPEKVQAIGLGSMLPLDLELAYLPDSKAPILAVGCTDKLIRIYTISPNNEYIHTLSLEGHEDWVRCLSFTSYPSPSDASREDLVLASGSQDNYIRLWRVSCAPEQDQGQEEQVKSAEADTKEGLDLLDEFERRLNGEGSGQISTKAHVMSVQDGGRSLRYNITLEALLVGHESGLTNAHWSPPSKTISSSPLLLSTAADNSLIIWVPSSVSTSSDGIWVPEHRFGAIGGRGLSFYGALWGKGGQSVIASGWNGGLERWVKVQNGDEEEVWEVRSGVNGHYGDVQSLTWDPRGEYLISVSSDQTSRIHAESSTSANARWAEIARPQIHGYDMTDIAFISPLRFVSSADEKVARVFDAPEGFVESLRTLGVSSSSQQEEGARPKGATVPPLGLSNRALQKAIISISHTLTSLPTEEELATSTLWPEIEKIYGHGYELVCVASSSDGKLVATSSKSTNIEHAGIRIYSTENWELVGQVLKGHSLTVTRICFSPNDRYILSCSRDRSWRLFKRSEDEGVMGYEVLVEMEKAHSRMILDCCWAETSEEEEGGMFATASRDKTVKIWIPAQEDKTQWKASETIKFNDATTSVSMISAGDNKWLLAVGTEIGSISIYSLEKVEGEIKSKELVVFDERYVVPRIPS